MINLEKLDPNVVKIIVERTAKSTVHKKAETFVEKDGKHRHEAREDIETIKRRIRKINEALRERGVGLYLSVNGEINARWIRVDVRETENGKLVAVLDEEDLARIFSGIHDTSGIILDRKG